LLFAVGAVPKIPFWLTVDVEPAPGLLAVDAPAVFVEAVVELELELLAIVPVVPPSEPRALLPDALVPKLPMPVVLVVDGAATALEVIEALVGRVRALDSPGPAPPPVAVVLVLELELDVGEVMTPAALTLARGEVT